MKKKCGEEQYKEFVIYQGVGMVLSLSGPAIFDKYLTVPATALLRKAVEFLEQMKGE
jgi:hypothetical protein